MDLVLTTRPSTSLQAKTMAASRQLPKGQACIQLSGLHDPNKGCACSVSDHKPGGRQSISVLTLVGDCIASVLTRLENISIHGTTGHFTVHSFVPEKATYKFFNVSKKGIPYLGPHRTAALSAWLLVMVKHLFADWQGC